MDETRRQQRHGAVLGFPHSPAALVKLVYGYIVV